MGQRNEILKEQLANDSARRPLGYNNSGNPALMGLIDLIPGQIRVLRGDGNVDNKFEILDWVGGVTTGLSGTVSRTPDQVKLKQVQTVVAFITGMAADYSEGYSAIAVATFRRAAAGDEVQIGATTVLLEHKSNVGGSCDISVAGSGGLSIDFDSGQGAKQYTWSVKAIVIANVNA